MKKVMAAVQIVLLIAVGVLIAMLVWGYIQYGDLLHFLRDNPMGKMLTIPGKVLSVPGKILSIPGKMFGK